jgi:curved DNA-binding protein CbpA
LTDGASDLYAALGVPAGATPADIRHAYRAIVRRYHPDRRAATDLTRDAAPDDKLARAITAYHVLSSPDRRAD